ncbi:MAG: CHAT domain-containing protein [Rhizobacter sp.]|nr:CHAT domain-containing protein [Ferruginibacter sp.]
MKPSILIVFYLLVFANAICQKNDEVADVEQLIKAENFKEANRLINTRLIAFFNAKNVDTIGDYINYLGKTTNKIKGAAAAEKEVLAIVQKAKSAFPYHKALVPIYLEAAFFVSNQGDNELAYKLVLEVDHYFITKQSVITSDLSPIQSNMGDFAMRLGKNAQASGHYLKSIEYLKRNPKPDAQKMYFANNSLGIVMWYSSKIDSAVFYFSKAIDALNAMEANPLNRHFRVALVQNNIGSCYTALGKTQEAISTFEKVISNYKEFVSSPEPHAKKENARINQYQAIDNLAKVYLELGDFTKAHDLLFYSYQQKAASFGSKSPEVYKSLIFLGTIYNNQRNYLKAQTSLNNALSHIKEQGDINISWAAEAYWQLAVAAQELKDNKAAAAHFEEANRIYEIVYAGQYDDLYLSYLGNMTMFYATNNEALLAVNLANKGLNYVKKVQGENSLGNVLQLKNLAEVDFELKKYRETITAASTGLNVVDKIIAKSSKMIDSIRIEMEKPRLILLKAKASYELTAKNDTAAIVLLLNELYVAKDILDKRKSILFEQKDVNILIANSKDLLDFIKKLNYELYNHTGKINYLDQMIGLHESGMYARIRSRMDKQKAIRFAKVPPGVIEQETKLKEAIQSSLDRAGSHDEKIRAYLSSINQWNQYQQMLRTKYAAYYNMRYASNQKTLKEFSQAIPAGINLLRYYFNGEDLFVLVASREKQKLVPLPSANLQDIIAVLNDPKTTAAEIGKASFNLYGQLWKPVEKEINSKRIIIIPDDFLYNLSFEMLSPVVVKTYKELSSQCLLNKYAISYHYSLLALSSKKAGAPMKDNFIGFSPEFSDKQKKDYSSVIKNDSLHMDNTYLSLLPLPFTTSLAKKIQNKLGGQLFLNDESTPAAFKTQAGNHSIIHIGTHAESNNNSPEFSRLIFAKDPQRANTENSLYLFDIYNCDLSSDLSVLTACESGKPGYQDGEGMISMAHAFTYAGSESILTGLWKIDEQTSTIITDLFYKNLQEGITKDEALRQAKLSYLQQSDGRMLAPQYWAGLVIMGDSSPIIFKENSQTKWYWIGGIAFILSFIALSFFLKKSKPKNS